MPRDMRASYRGKGRLRFTVEPMIGRNPERIILAHGRVRSQWHGRIAPRLPVAVAITAGSRGRRPPASVEQTERIPRGVAGIAWALALLRDPCRAGMGNMLTRCWLRGDLGPFRCRFLLL